MRRWLRRLARRGQPVSAAPKLVWKLRLRLAPGVVYVAAPNATAAVEQACALMEIQPNEVISIEMYASALDRR